MATHRPLQDRVARGVMRAVGALPPRVQRALGGRPTRIDGQELHPEIQIALRLLRLTAGRTFEQLPCPKGAHRSAAKPGSSATRSRSKPCAT